MLDSIISYVSLNNTYNPLNIINSTNEIILFGLGQYFDEAFLRQNVKNRFHVKYLCDNNPEKWGKTFHGLTCLSPYEVKSLSKSSNSKLAVIIMLGHSIRIFQQMSEIIGPERCFTYDYLSLVDRLNEPRDPDFFLSSVDKIFDAYSMIKEEQSKIIFINILAHRLAPHLANKKVSELMSSYPLYFDPVVTHLSKEEIFIDCGAYIGDTISSFLQNVQNEFSSIAAFELSAANFKTLSTNISQYPREISKKINLYNIGVSDHSANIKYSEDCSNEGISLYSNSKLALHNGKIARLDELLTNNQVSFIKMDIGGEEMAALRGAEDIIKLNRPRCAISVYHRTSDFWNVPLFFNQVMPDCEIRFRHYNSLVFLGTVCHIIPPKDTQHA